jgi:phage-related protein
VSLDFTMLVDIISDIDLWSIEVEPEVEDWLGQLRPGQFGTAGFHLDRLAEHGAGLRMPHSRPLGGGLFELRFDVERSAWRITYWFAPGRRIVPLTVFRKQRMSERAEIERARAAMTKCAAEEHAAEEDE